MIYFGGDNFVNFVLTVCFIISITIANCILIYKNIRKGQFLYTPRSLIMISLAIGDIVVTILVLVVILLFGINAREGKLDCSTYKVFETSRYFLIHFVYGLGLAVLAAEFVQRNRNPQSRGNTSSNHIKCIVYSAFPWIIGLIVILPLTMADAYTDDDWYDSCSMSVTKSRWQAMFVVSVILPAILAVLACIAVMFIKLSPSSPATVSYHGPTQGVINSQNTSLINTAGPSSYPESNAAAAQSYPTTSMQGPQQFPSDCTTGTAQAATPLADGTPGPNNGVHMISTSNGQYPVQQGTTQQDPVQQYPAQQNPVQQYPGQQYPVQQIPIQQYPVQQDIPQQDPVQQYPAQQHPWQQYAAQQDPVQQYPVKQYPVRQHPGQPYPAQQGPVQQHPVQQNPVQQYPGQQYPVQQYPTQQYPTPHYAVQYPPPQYPVQQHTPPTNIVYTAPTNIVHQSYFSGPEKEKIALIMVAIINFICVIPLAGHVLSPSLDTLVLVCLFWISVSRSLITPIIFILFN